MPQAGNYNKVMYCHVLSGKTGCCVKITGRLKDVSMSFPYSLEATDTLFKGFFMGFSLDLEYPLIIGLIIGNAELDPLTKVIGAGQALYLR